MAPAPQFVGTLKGSVVVIIGGTSGIGFAVAKAVIEEGGSVFVGSSSQAKIDRAIERLGDSSVQFNADPARVAGHVVDLSGEGSEASLQKFFAALPASLQQPPQHDRQGVEGQGKFDHLVLTSGVINSVPLEHATYKDIVAIGDVRYIGTILAVKQAVYGGGLRRGGSIVLTSAATYKYPNLDWSIMSGFTGAIPSLTINLALDLSRRDIRVNCVSPGPIVTELFDGFPAAIRERLAARGLNARVGQPEEIALTYLSLIKNRNINGETVHDDGGHFAQRPSSG